jgi:hypothetical protein
MRVFESYLVDELEEKADKADVDKLLSAKANNADVDKLLSAKANKAEVESLSKVVKEVQSALSELSTNTCTPKTPKSVLRRPSYGKAVSFADVSVRPIPTRQMEQYTNMSHCVKIPYGDNSFHIGINPCYPPKFSRIGIALEQSPSSSTTVFLLGERRILSGSGYPSLVLCDWKVQGDPRYLTAAVVLDMEALCNNLPHESGSIPSTMFWNGMSVMKYDGRDERSEPKPSCMFEFACSHSSDVGHGSAIRVTYYHAKSKRTLPALLLGPPVTDDAGNV